MAGSAEAAKNFLESAFNKTKEVVSTAAETTKGYANVAINKIIPGQGQPGADGAAAPPAAPGAPGPDPNAPGPQAPQ
uniref:Small hydrophilic protein n=1 Tax=Steinernema glaseri TaxID=37863 RepID=A0A1I7Z8N0_9BILA